MGIPQDLFERARCIAIMPVGGEYKEYKAGYLSCRNVVGPGWSAPGTIRIEGGSFEFQTGASSADLILLTMNARGTDKLLSDKFTLGGKGSVVAGPVGRTATTQTDAQINADILAWSRSRGLIAGVALEGATLRQDVGASPTSRLPGASFLS
jgi:lipid-binding SYLF domain-containing protein